MALHIKWKRVLRWALALLALLVCAAIGIFFYVRSDSFRNSVRERMVADIQGITGGRVELKGFTWNLSRLEFEADDLTIHGLERPGEVPYAHLDRALISVKIVSVLGRKIALNNLELQHPVFHLIVYPDGATNQPSPKKAHMAGLSSSQLFQVEIGQVEIHDGLLLLNDKKIPLDLRAAKVAASLDYQGSQKNSYAGKLSVGSIDLKYRNGRQLVSQADASFVIRKNAADISSLHWSSGDSSVSATATLRDFQSPKVEATYTGKIDLRTVAQVFDIPEIRSGGIEFNGSGRYLSRSDFYSSGNLKLKNAAVSSRAIRIRDVQAISQFAIAQDSISLTRVSGRAVGGSFAGNATLDHWANIVPTASIGTSRHTVAAKRLEPEGHIQLAIKGIPVRDAERAITPAKSPVQQLHLASTATGNVDVKWKGTPADSQTTVKVAINADPSAPPSSLPLNGTVEATYYSRADRLEVPNLALASQATRLNASGTLSSDSQLRISLNSTDLSELEPVAEAFGATGQSFPAVVHGHASFNGIVTGKLSSPNVIGRLEATNFDFTVPPEFWSAVGSSTGSTPAKSPPTLHWDSLSANVSYSPQSSAAHNVLLRRGKADLSGDVVVGLESGELAASSPIHAHVTLRNTDITDIQALAGQSYPITGTLTGQLALSGTKDDLQVRGRLQAQGGTILGEPYRSAAATLHIRGQQLTIESAALQEDGGQITGNGGYNLTSRAIQFEATGKNFSLAHLARLQSRKISVGGTVEFTASGSGTPEQPNFSARLLGKDLVFSGEPAGDLAATAETRGHNLHVQAHSNTQFESFNAEGDIGLSRDLPAQIRLDLTRLDFDPLLRVYLAGKLTGHSSVSGTFLLSGPLRHPDDITVTGNVQQFSASVQNISLHNDGPLRFTLSHQVASIQQMHIVGTDTDINATGTAQFAGERKLDLHANGKVSMGILQTLDPNLVSSGEMTFAVNATGTVDDPSMAGNVEIANGALALVDLPNGLSAVNGRLTFDTNRLRIQRLTAKTGGGDLNLGGYVTYSNGLFFDLNATGKDIRLRYPEGVSSQANASLRLVGSPQNSVLSGDITVTKFGLTQQFDLATYVERARQTSAPPSPNSPLNNVRLDVHVVSTPELRVETSLARLSGDVDLHLRGTAARPSVLGRVSIAEGDITFNSTTYHLERGDIIFANPVRIEPVINVEASARVRDYDITLGFHGTPDKLSVTYRSEPPLPSADIIALLAFGRTRQESEIQAEQGSQAASAQSFAQTASNAILGEALNSAVSSRVQKLFGISRIKIDPNLGGTEDNPNARLTIEQQISKNVTVTYLTNLGQYAEEVLQVEYNINKNISIVAVRDYTGVLAIDLRIRQRKR